MTKLCDLARRHQTDKGGNHLKYGGQDTDCCHNYTPVYARLFDGKEDKVRGVLEIGVHAGCSLRMWKEYFPNASIVGIDNNEECIKHTEQRITVLTADQNNPKSLCDAIGMLHPDGPLFDLIIDDGSHIREHQITSLKTLLPFVKVGGYYVVEDLGTAPNPDVFQPIFDCNPRNGSFITTLHHITGGLGPKVQPFEWLISFERIK